MGNFKIVTVSVPKEDEQMLSLHYEKMGIELVNSRLYTVKSDSGVVLNQYYKNIYKFDQTQNNSEQLWAIYKKYKKKNRELGKKYKESNGEFCPTKAFLPITIIIAVICFPFFPTIFDLNFGEFIIWRSDWLSVEKEMDISPLVYSILLAPVVGFIASLITQLISFVFARKKRIISAVDSIAVLEKEIEELIYQAQGLKNQ